MNTRTKSILIKVDMVIICNIVNKLGPLNVTKYDKATKMTEQMK